MSTWKAVKIKNGCNRFCVKIKFQCSVFTPFFGGQKYNVIEAKKLVADAEQEKSKVDYNNRSMYLFILNIF